MKYFAIVVFTLIVACNMHERGNIIEQRAGSITIDSLGRLLQGTWQFDSMPGETMDFVYMHNGGKNYYESYITVNATWHHKDKETRPAADFNIFTGKAIANIIGRASSISEDSDFYYLCNVFIIHGKLPKVLPLFKIEKITQTRLTIYGGFLTDILNKKKTYYNLTKQ